MKHTHILSTSQPVKSQSRQSTQELFVHHDGGEGKEWMDRVIIPTSTTMVSVRGRHFKDGVPTEYVRNIEFTGVTFEDTTFDSFGFQSGRGLLPPTAALAYDPPL